MNLQKEYTNLLTKVKRFFRALILLNNCNHSGNNVWYHQIFILIILTMVLIPTRETTAVKLVSIPGGELIIYKKLLEKDQREASDKYYDVISIISSGCKKEDFTDSEKLLKSGINMGRMQEFVKFMKFKIVKSWNLDTEQWPIELNRENFDTYIQQDDLDVIEKVINPGSEEGKKKNEAKSDPK